jgi:hypothetical protein
VLIVAVLMAGSYLKNQYDEFHASQTRLADLQGGQRDIDAHLRALEQSVTTRARALEAASLDQLDARIAAIDSAIREKSAAQPQTGDLRLWLVAATGGGFVDHFKRDLEIRVLAQERDYLAGLRAVALALVDRNRAVAELERLRQAHAVVYAQLTNNVLARSQLADAHPLAGRVPGTGPHRLLAQLDAAQAALLAQNQNAHDAYQRQRTALAAFKLPAAPPAFKLQQAPLREALAPLTERIAALEKNPIAALWESAVSVVPAALGILLGLLLLPLALKALFYFVLAPWAARQPPVHLLPGTSGALDVTGASAVSQTVLIDPNHELLIDPDYLQSSSVAGTKQTQWLLDWSHPFTSLAAGLFALTRIRTAGQESVVVSALTDPLSEVALLSLPQGAALVLQPRSLAGVLQPTHQPLRITSHWRLGTLHGWLTLQLRYLVFHGPATLVVKGCRGIRVEPGGGGRRINQAATLGFCANLEYATTRIETFLPYLTGKQGLLDDRFGGAGCYVYEEVPHRGAGTGVTGRGLEGFSDAVLKVFGI